MKIFKLILPISISLLIIGYLSAQDRDTTKHQTESKIPEIQKQENESFGGISVGIAPVEVTVLESYGSLVYANAEKQGVDIVDLTKPVNFEKEGVYIWKDDDNEWNIKIMHFQGRTLEALIKCQNQLKITKDSENLTQITQDGNIKIKSSSIKSDSSLLQFSCMKLPLEFDFTSNTFISSNQIFMGKQNKRPKDLIFSITDYNSVINFKDNNQNQSLNDSPESGGGGTIFPKIKSNTH